MARKKKDDQQVLAEVMGYGAVQTTMVGLDPDTKSLVEIPRFDKSFSHADKVLTDLARRGFHITIDIKMDGEKPRNSSINVRTTCVGPKFDQSSEHSLMADAPPEHLSLESNIAGGIQDVAAKAYRKLGLVKDEED